MLSLGRQREAEPFIAFAHLRQLTADEHPFATRLPNALERAGVETIAFRVPYARAIERASSSGVRRDP